MSSRAESTTIAGMVERFGIDLAGRTLAGRYEVLELLGAGGMGVVYRAHDRELDEVVALKVIHRALADQPEVVDRFRREVKLARRVTHTNIARTFELGSADGVMFCTMELIEGESLRDRLGRARKLSVVEAAMIARALCEGLAVAHAAGIIHRDIKPGNVLIANDGRVILADFGIAALTVAAGAGAGDVSGTPAYMAPEQARGETPTPTIDVYAVGVLLYEMVTGRRAFTGDLDSILEAKQEVAELRTGGDVPAELGQLIGHATARDASARIGSAAELGRRLGAWTRLSPTTIAVPRRATHRDVYELHVVIVLAPRAAAEGAAIHLAQGVHEELLRRLTRVPRLRVLPRVEAGDEPAATVVELVTRTDLEARIRIGGTLIVLRVPLAVTELSVAADTIVSAISSALDREPSAAPARDAQELMLRAREAMQRSIANYEPAFEMLQRANRLAPDDPQIAATLALACVRVATFDPDDQHGWFARGRELVRTALRTAPNLAASHVAAAHLEIHTGEAATSAIHFRRAIACSRFVAEGHEGLGRLLLEAGFLDVAMPRLDEALAIAPSLATIRWDIARAWALEGRWDLADPIIDALHKTNDRVVARARYACWKGDRVALAAIRDREASSNTTGPASPLLESFYSTLLDGAWEDHRDALVARGTTTRVVSKRAHAFLAQIVAEVAGAAGDGTTSLAMIAHAVEVGLFDLHWIDRCPLLAAARRLPGFFAMRARVKARADAIFDALYGDLELGALSDTVAV